MRSTRIWRARTPNCEFISILIIIFLQIHTKWPAQYVGQESENKVSCVSYNNLKIKEMPTKIPKYAREIHGDHLPGGARLRPNCGLPQKSGRSQFHGRASPCDQFRHPRQSWRGHNRGICDRQIVQNGCYLFINYTIIMQIHFSWKIAKIWTMRLTSYSGYKKLEISPNNLFVIVILSWRTTPGTFCTRLASIDSKQPSFAVHPFFTIPERQNSKHIDRRSWLVLSCFSRMVILQIYIVNFAALW